ncbi:MAG: S8 family serine peptidase [Parcubacteria group bacterium]
MKSKLIISLIIFSFAFAMPVFATNDPYSNFQWYLPDIKADKAWLLTKGSATVVVAVIDTGVDLNHPDLTGNIWTNGREIPGDAIDNEGNGFIDDSHGWNFVKNNAKPSPTLSGSANFEAVSHGTFVSGLIAAAQDNGHGISGVAPGVRIMPLVALDENGYGNSANVAKAIDYAVANGASIINLSFGGYEYSSALKKSIDNAYRQGVLIVAASGNMEKGNTAGRDLTKHPVYPVCYDRDSDVNKVLGVIATDLKHKVAPFTNYGEGCIDIAAPGVDLISLNYHDAGYAQLRGYVADHWQGSSFATALVSGAAALLKSYNPSLTPAQMITALTGHSGILFVDQDKYRGQVGEGMLDVYQAMQSVTAGPGVIVSVKNVAATALPANSPAQIFVSPKSGKSAAIRVFNAKLENIAELSIIGGAKFKGINFQLDAVDAEAHKVIAAGATTGSDPLVRVLSITGEMLHSFYAFDTKFKGGVEVATGDVNGDGEAEIVAVPQGQSSSIVKVFDADGKLLNQFYAYDKSYAGGLHVRIADMDGDGVSEIAIAPRAGMMPKIKFFSGLGQLKKSLTVYDARFLGGVNFNLVDINKDGKIDVLTGQGKGGAPVVKAVDYNGKQLLSFTAYDKTFNGGVEVTSADWNSDGKMEIITAPSTKGGPHVKIFDQKGKLLQEFFAWESTFTGGVNIDAK